MVLMRKPSKQYPKRRRSRQLSRLELIRSRGGLSLVPQDEIPALVEESLLTAVRGGAVFEPNDAPLWKRTEVKDAHD
jgi:hypothetical protein